MAVGLRSCPIDSPAMNNADGEALDRGNEVLGRILYRFADADWVMQVQRPYVQFFSDIKAHRVLDVGCGRGLFLTLLREAGSTYWRR